MQSHAFNLDSTRVWTLNSKVVTLSWMPGRELRWSSLYQQTELLCQVIEDPQAFARSYLGAIGTRHPPTVWRSYLHWGRIPHQLRGDQSGPFPMKSWRQEQVNGKKVAIDIGERCERCESFSQISFCKGLVPVTQPSTRCVVSHVHIVLRCQLASAQWSSWDHHPWLVASRSRWIRWRQGLGQGLVQHSNISGRCVFQSLWIWFSTGPMATNDHQWPPMATNGHQWPPSLDLG